MKRRTIATSFWIGDTVYHRTNADAIPGLVVAVTIAHSGGILYTVAWRGFREDQNRQMELTAEKPGIELPEVAKDKPAGP